VVESFQIDDITIDWLTRQVIPLSIVYCFYHTCTVFTLYMKHFDSWSQLLILLFR